MNGFPEIVINNKLPRTALSEDELTFLKPILEGDAKDAFVIYKTLEGGLRWKAMGNPLCSDVMGMLRVCTNAIENIQLTNWLSSFNDNNNQPTE